MKLHYTTPALADLKGLARYIDPHSPQGARRVQQRIKHLIEQLPHQPFIGKVTDDPTIRRLTTTPYPYLIFYEVTDAEIIIHAVRHGARDPSTMPRQS
ncbi:type II toxin-antitoxin system RelE/ParE family toxin [Agrobacterium tumefaciens]|uniref:type II toxin-antitoxin system RelE/ParE family toxin n=1 Tax=Agrobacterium tumefaciens TaxID=358 RepID=UPI0009754700|nr:stabilization protein [Agrobacterium tumefaciens]